MDDDTWLVVGLGNPGPGYAGNRHNVGQMALAQLADRASLTFKNHKTNAAVAEGRSYAAGPRLVLAKPNTYMNVSGGPVAALLRFYKVPVARLIVLHDELDIPFDTVRLKFGGGHGGHKGLREIIAATRTGEVPRRRTGHLHLDGAIQHVDQDVSVMPMRHGRPTGRVGHGDHLEFMACELRHLLGHEILHHRIRRRSPMRGRERQGEQAGGHAGHQTRKMLNVHGRLPGNTAPDPMVTHGSRGREFNDWTDANEIVEDGRVDFLLTTGCLYRKLAVIQSPGMIHAKPCT